MTNLRRLIAASGLSNLADGVFQIALPLIALGITRSPGAFASVTVVGRLPWLLAALPAGALADRLDRRRTMVQVDLARVVAIGGLGAVVASGHEELWILYVVAFALGVGETLFDTAAQSIVPNIVAPDQLSYANGRLAATEITANQLVGPPLGGLIASATLAGALAVSAGGYLLAAGALMLLVGSFRPERIGAPTSIRADMVEGVRYLYRHRVLRTLAVGVGLTSLALTAELTILPLFAVDPGPMGLSPTGFGILLAATGIGPLAASFTVERVEAALGRHRALVVALAGFPLTMVAPAFTTSPWIVGGSYIAFGFVVVMWSVITVSLRQRIVPDHLRGRVNAGYRVVGLGTMPLGAALAGVLGETFGVRAVFAIASAVVLLPLPIFLAYIRPADLEDGAGA